MTGQEHLFWPAAVQAAQMLSTLTWLAATHNYVPATIRVLRGRSTNNWDGMGCWAWAMGMVQIGMTARWLLLGGDDIAAMSRTSLMLWVPLYLLNAMVAIGILYTWRDDDYVVGVRRARAGLLMWGGVAVLCTAAAFWTA